jgi:hypothetical protein
MVRHCIDNYGWSPFMKSYKGRNLLTAAILGKKKKIVEYLLSLEYKGDEHELKLLYSGKDDSNRGPMHHAYMVGDPDIIYMLKQAGFTKKNLKDVFGLYPEQCKHKQMGPDSDSEPTDSEDENDNCENMDMINLETQETSQSSRKFKIKTLLRSAAYCFVTTKKMLPILET